jgi:hypothetical protein
LHTGGAGPCRRLVVRREGSQERPYDKGWPSLRSWAAGAQGCLDVLLSMGVVALPWLNFNHAKATTHINPQASLRSGPCKVRTFGTSRCDCLAAV